MKVLKKILLVIISIILALGIVVMIYFQIRKSNAGKQLVSIHSTAVGKIAIDDILIDVLWDEFKRNSLLTKDSLAKEKDSKKWDIGVDIPSSLYFFSVDDKNNTLYTYQKIKDEKLFLKQISKVLGIDSIIIHREGEQWWFQKGRVKCIGDSKNVLLRIRYEIVDDKGQMNSMWDNRNNVFQEIKNLESIKGLDLKGDLVYYDINSRDKFVMNFEEGVVKAKVYLETIYLKAKTNRKVRKMDDDNAILTAYCNIDLELLNNVLKSNMNKYSKNKSLIDSISGYADVQWKKGNIFQSDTIVDYEYDDNFELVEVESVRQVDVPNITFTIKGTPDFYADFTDKIVYKVSKKVDKGYLVLTTDTKHEDHLILVDSEEFINLKYKYDESVNSYINKIPNFNMIKEISISGKSTSTNEAIIEAEIKLHDSKKHPLVTILEKL